MLRQRAPEDIVICSGGEHSLREFVEVAFKQLGLDYRKYVKTDKKFCRPLDLETIYGDNSKAKELIGWEYAISFEDLIVRLINDETAYLDWLATVKKTDTAHGRG